MKDKLILNNVTFYYPSLHTPRTGFGGKGLNYEVTIGLNDDHIKQLTDAGVSAEVFSPAARGMVSRYRPLTVKNKETGESTTLADKSFTMKRKAKNANKEYTFDKASATNKIRVEDADGNTITDLVGNGSTGDVSIMLNDIKGDIVPYISSVTITNLVPVASKSSAGSDFDAIDTLDAVRAKLS